MSNAHTHEPPPQPGVSVALGLVMADLAARAEVGRVKYGTLLMTHNGRDALTDAYQEALDLCMYLRQAIAERDGVRCESDAAVIAQGATL